MCKCEHGITYGGSDLYYETTCDYHNGARVVVNDLGVLYCYGYEEECFNSLYENYEDTVDRPIETVESITPYRYIQNVLKTESLDIEKIRERMQSEFFIRLNHSFEGINTESGELTDILKKYLYYGKEVDTVNIKEELGDLLWYVAIACDVLDISFEDIMVANINKLAKRYRNQKFTEDQALNRDLKEERKELEYKVCETNESMIEAATGGFNQDEKKSKE